MSNLIDKLQINLNRFEWERTIAVQADLRFLCTMAIALLAGIGWLGSQHGYKTAFEHLGSKGVQSKELLVQNSVHMHTATGALIYQTLPAVAADKPAKPVSPTETAALVTPTKRPIDIVKAAAVEVSPLAFAVLGLLLMAQFVARSAVKWEYMMLPSIKAYRRIWKEFHDSDLDESLLTEVARLGGHDGAAPADSESDQHGHPFELDELDIRWDAAENRFLERFRRDQADMLSQNFLTNNERRSLITKAVAACVYALTCLALAFLNEVVGLHSCIWISWGVTAVTAYAAVLHYRESFKSAQKQTAIAHGPETH